MDNNNTEVWMPVVGFAGYEVSNTGRVRSYLARGINQENKTTPTVMTGGSKATGYRYVILRRNNKSFNRLVHQLVLEAFVGPRPEGTETGHLDGNPTNNNVSNLAWITHQENMSHIRLHGTENYACGEASGTSKLTESQVIEIRSRLSTESHDEIAKDYDVDANNIKAIHRGVIWKHLGPVPVPYVPQYSLLTEQKLDELVACITGGMTIIETAAAMNVDFSTVARAFKRHTGQSIRDFKRSKKHTMIEHVAASKAVS